MAAVAPVALEEPVVRARGLVKRYGDYEAVRGIDFEVRAGSCCGFLGPNGAGKTTTLRMILGLAPYQAGELEVFGAPVGRDARAMRARIGIVPQLDNLDPDFTVAENLRVYGSYFRIPPAVLEPRIGRLLKFMELDDRAGSAIGSLSGGMRRRLTLARALVNDPELIVLDEPTTGLDPQARHMIWGRLNQLVREGRTLLLTTHYMEEAERLCDDIVVMDHGRILDRGSPRALAARHVEPEVVELRDADEAMAERLRGCGEGRVEAHGDTWYCYTRDARPFVRALQGMDDVQYLHRPANLEDVFLRLTGRELRD